MNAAEMMAMVDERLSDGRTYPTLDEYTVALRTIVERDRLAASPMAQREWWLHHMGIGMSQLSQNATSAALGVISTHLQADEARASKIRALQRRMLDVQAQMDAKAATRGGAGGHL